MTDFYLCFPLIVNAPHLEHVCVRDSTFVSGTISYHMRTGKWELYIKNKGTTFHNTLHLARKEADRILRQVYVVTQCYNN